MACTWNNLLWRTICVIFSQALGKSEKPVTVCVHSIHRSPEEWCFTAASQLLPPGRKQLLLLIPCPWKTQQAHSPPFIFWESCCSLLQLPCTLALSIFITALPPPLPLKLTILFPAPNCYRPSLLDGFLQLFLNILKSCDFERCHDCERGLGFSQNSLFSSASFFKHAFNHKAQPSPQLQQLFFTSLHVSVKDSGKSSLFRSPLYSHELPKTNESEMNVLIVLSQMRKTLCEFNRARPQIWQLFKQVSDVPHDMTSKYYPSFWMLSG